MADPQHGHNEHGVNAAFIYVGGSPIGPTVDDPEHEGGEAWRVLERNGGFTERAGDSRITGWNTHLRFRAKDMRGQFRANELPGSSSDGSSVNVRTMARAQEFFTEGDYIRNVWYVYRVHDPVTGQKRFDAYVYPLMRAEQTRQSGGDNNEQILDCDWKAILLAGQDDDECPYIHVENFDVATFDIDDYVTYDTP